MKYQRFGLGIALSAALAAGGPAWGASGPQPVATPSSYQGWTSLCLSNGLIELQVLPDIGGRVIQFTLGHNEFLWVNRPLAGKLPPNQGLAADGSWFNVGGDKLWPAPQGWDNDQQWPGPPDAVLDGQPYLLEELGGAVFVQRFVFEPERDYPDGSSVEFWLNGVGQIHAYNRDMVMPTNAAENPCVFESEVLSPYASLQPGETYTWHYDWFACNIGGDFPVLDCSEVGLVAERFSAERSSGQARLQGRFGVFAPGILRAEFANAQGRPLGSADLPFSVSPLQPVVLDTVVAAPLDAVSVKLVVIGADHKAEGELAEAKLSQRTTDSRWPAEKAWQWYRAQPWLVGCNFLPSTAVNDVEMWQKETFDAKTIERELGWAEELGFNTVRVFLNFVVWREDAAGLKERFAKFLHLAERHGISVMPILLDDCNFAGRVAAAGPQPDPVPGVHNSQWVSSPPLAMVTDRSAWPALEQYVKDLVGTFAQDRRIVVWDLYNEPGNGMGDKSQGLMEAAFRWARQSNPTQPLTTGAWEDFSSPFSRRMMELSDVVSFHGYDPVPGIEAKLKICATFGRPVLCTEWLVRRGGNTFEELLPLFRDRKIGCWNWGLVAGRTQTYFPWGSPRGAPEPKRWQHDILRADGSPFIAREVRFIQVTTGKLPASALPLRTTLVPSAETSPVP